MKGKVNEIAAAKKLYDDLWAEVGQARAERDATKTELADTKRLLEAARNTIHDLEQQVKAARQAGTQVPAVK